MLNRNCMLLVAILQFTNLVGAQEEGDLFEGRWTIEIMERGGKKPPAELLESVTVVFKENTITFEDGHRNEAGEFKLRPAEKPAEIDVVFKEGPNADVERTALGIYELKDGRLKLAWRKDGGKRPMGFFSNLGERTSELWILKRAKEN